MKTLSTTPRLNRLFGADGKCFAVALDHAVHHEPSFLDGIENLAQVIATVAPLGPDAMLLSVGQAHLLQNLAGKNKPALILRTDPTNFYSHPTPGHVFCQMIERPVEQALALDAASVIANLFWAPDQPDLHHQCLSNICKLKAECERFGVPLVVETLLMIHDSQGRGYRPDLDICRNVSLVRQAAELGADIIKSGPVENVDDYHRIIEAAAGKPVLPLGGPKIPDEVVLSRTHALIQQGARGIVYGRNVFQHPQPERITKACRAIVHEGASLAQAMEILNHERD